MNQFSRRILSYQTNGALITLALFAMHCDSGHDMTHTGSTCPETSTLTYENFGKPFMEQYCTRCHHSALEEGERNGAPLFHDFDSLFGILAVSDHVDLYTAAGPDAENTIMPPDGAIPTLAERFQLGEWVACEEDKLDSL